MIISISERGFGNAVSIHKTKEEAIALFKKHHFYICEYFDDFRFSQKA